MGNNISHNGGNMRLSLIFGEDDSDEALKRPDSLIRISRIVNQLRSSGYDNYIFWSYSGGEKVKDRSNEIEIFKERNKEILLIKGKHEEHWEGWRITNKTCKINGYYMPWLIPESDDV